MGTGNIARQMFPTLESNAEISFNIDCQQWYEVDLALKWGAIFAVDKVRKLCRRLGSLQDVDFLPVLVHRSIIGLDLGSYDEDMKPLMIRLKSYDMSYLWRQEISKTRSMWKDFPIYEDRSRIGKGSFGQVFLSKHKFTDTACAVKHIPENDSMVYVECSVMAEVQHENLMPSLGTWVTNKELCIPMPLMAEGCFYEFLKIQDGRKLREDVAKQCMYEILKGVKALQGHRYLHGDLKPENVLVHIDHSRDIGKELVLRISDFGLTRYLPPGKRFPPNRRLGTLLYRAPEILDGNYFGLEADIWSCGCILYEILTGKLLFRAKTRHDMKRKISRGYLPKHETLVVPSARDIVSKMLQKDLKYRISIDDALNHPWFFS